MTTLWNFILAHWGTISVIGALILKWIYNAWTPGVTFSAFVRAFIGEVVQEAPASAMLKNQPAPAKKDATE